MYRAVMTNSFGKQSNGQIVCLFFSYCFISK